MNAAFCLTSWFLDEPSFPSPVAKTKSSKQQFQSLLTRTHRDSIHTICSKSSYYSDVNIVHHRKREMAPLSVWSTIVRSSPCGCLCKHKLSPGRTWTACGQAVSCITSTPNRSVLSSQPLVFNKYISSLQSCSSVWSLAVLPRS